MKATRLLIVTAIITGFAALSFAGPGPDYQTRMQKSQRDKARAEAAAKIEAAAKVANCSACGCAALKKS